MDIKFWIREHVELQVDFPVSVHSSILEKND